MLTDSRNSALYSAWLDHIKDGQTRRAFLSIVGLAACLREWQCHPEQKGAVRDVRFFAPDGRQHFAFIVNIESLLFYFRKPAVQSGKYDFRSLQERFDGAGQNNSGEWTVRLRGPDDVNRLAEYMALS
jgi:hypothetical protein